MDFKQQKQAGILRWVCNLKPKKSMTTKMSPVPRVAKG